MPAVPWQLVLLHPLGITLTVFSTFMFVFLWVLIMKTPAMTFFKAGFGKRMVLINPDQDRRIVFRIASKDSDMAYVKKRGYYIINPGDVYIESSSKIPCATTYGLFGESINPKGAEFSEQLKKTGVSNYIELVNSCYDQVPASVLFKKKFITKEEYEAAPNKVYPIPKKDKPELKILGKSVSYDNIIQYFSKNTRADLIESKIQHRISAIKMEKLAGASNLFKWAVILVIVLIGAALAYNMVAMGRTEPVQAAAQTPGGIGGIVGAGVDAVSGGGTGLT